MAAITTSGVASDRLLVYTYDSFASWGPASIIERAFEEEYGIDVQFLAISDSREMLARLIAEVDSGLPTADVFIGIEAADIARVKRLGLFQTLPTDELPVLRDLPEDLLLDPDSMLVPYEHGYITLVYDSERTNPEDLPQTFEELTDPRFRDAIILEDPRVSSPGLSFLLWTIAEYGDPGYLDYWQRLLPNVLTITGGWSEAYNLFLAGEAPFVVSFSTDTAYSVIGTGSRRHRVLLLNNGGYRTVYFMGIVATTAQPELARALLEIVLSLPVQEAIPTTEWMFPVHPEALLPIAFYQNAVVPPRALMIPPETVDTHLDVWLSSWSRVVVGP
jgi:thiamine transport system substrate-binding protein